MTFARFLSRLCVLFVVVSVAAGCGSNKPRAYPVTGKVTGSEKPLKGIIIRFQPVDGEKGVFSSGTIKDDGGYDLTTTDGRRGALPGKYKVVFALGSGAMQEAMAKMSKSPKKKSGPQMMRPGMKAPPGGFSSVGGGGAPEFDTPYPASYGSAETTPQEVEVKAGTNNIDIAIQK